MKPKILFVDDRTKRIHWALENWKNCELTIATCVPEALRQMVSQKWDIISLDHDLNGHDFEDPDTPTCGMEIVRYLEKCNITYQSGILGEYVIFKVHSSNLFASHLMIVRLMNLGYSAFSSKIDYETENMTYDKEGLPK